MNDLIKALTIFAKYKQERWPTICEHDVLIIVGIEYDEVMPEDRVALELLSFTWSDEFDAWASSRFGSA